MDYLRASQKRLHSGKTRYQWQVLFDIVGRIADDWTMKYPGGKGRTYHQIINLMPPHDRYIETHLGGGAVMRHKRPATSSIGIDRDENVLSRWKERPEASNMTLVHGDAIEVMRELSLNRSDLVYIDPPYFPSTRRRRRVYRFEYTEDDHCLLLRFVANLNCMALISGYRCELYDQLLPSWRRVDFPAWTHTGFRTESVWLNYPLPTVLHDPRYIGNDHHKRQDVKRRMARWQTRLGGLSAPERSVLFDWLQNLVRDEEALTRANGSETNGRIQS